jgi:hypothetical protein
MLRMSEVVKWNNAITYDPLRITTKQPSVFITDVRLDAFITREWLGGYS